LYGEGDIFTRAVYQSAYNDSMTPEEAIEYYSEQLGSGGTNHLLYNNLGVSFWQARKYREADFSLKSARVLFQRQFGKTLNPAVVSAGAPYLYNIGINLLSLSEQGIKPLFDDQHPATVYLDSALQADYFSLRIKKSYLDKIDEIIRDYLVSVIDMPQIFYENGGERLFIDHCHPTVKGHYIIAEEIVKVIKAKYRL
jgi:hypothetical protein